ncbi:hypothetical protein [Rheinheimera sp. F8]|uniref:hypothetical protein n=1 Tax=Rheinheimera sp. F8 TaxID=1763998 RepID=UPI000744850E|nr:hypothetical protein [Rheinheimera sp. F8]ALZ77346.1 hypothetical protein ATY27_17330 [Rheinheimera sp. F8]
MTSRVFLGLSSPSFYDYQNKASRTKNDRYSSPNPILENALGLSVFYDEIWFLCESLCPQSLREHGKIKFLDKELVNNRPEEIPVFHKTIENSQNKVYDINISRNLYDDYIEKVASAGVNWWDDEGRAIDNHTHELLVLLTQLNGNSSNINNVAIDIAICKQFENTLGFDLALNSYSKEIFRLMHPTHLQPTEQKKSEIDISTQVVMAYIQNCTTKFGPNSNVFDAVSNSKYCSEFRRYISYKKLHDAYLCYNDVVDEINTTIRKEIRAAADRNHSTKGLTKLFIEAAIDFIGAGLYIKSSQWFSSQLAPKPTGAAAFILDLKDSIY